MMALEADPQVGETVHPASLSQEALWFLDQTLPEPAVYNIPVAFRLLGPLHLEALQTGLNELIQRYEVLRTRFAWEGLELLQKVAPVLELDLPLLDFERLPEAGQRERLDELSLGMARRRFDLTEGPLLRALVVRLAPEEHVLMLTVHHIIFDGWSMQVFMAAWRETYRAACQGEAPRLPELPAQFGDYARRQRELLGGPGLDRQREYWRAQLAGAPGLLELPTDRPRGRTPSSEGGRYRLEVPVILVSRLKALARSGGGTLFMALLTGLQILLAKLSGQEDVVVGTVLGGRTSAGAWDQVGLFVNTLALRVDLSGDPTVREAFGRVRRVAMAGFANQELPFEEVVKIANPTRNAGHSPLFQAMLVMQNVARPEDVFLDIRERWEPVETGLAMFDLTLSLVEYEDGLEGNLEYAKGLFEHASIGRMVSQYLQVLEEMVEDPEGRIGALTIHAPGDGHRQPDSSIGETRAMPAKSLHARILRQMAATPDAIAATCRERRLSYGELEQLSAQVAAGLQARGVGLRTPVGVFMDPGLEQLVAVLGVLRAGGMYVPLDPKHPAERNRFALEDTGMGWILTDAASLDSLPVTSAKALCLDLDALAAAGPAHPAAVELAEAPASILYTSGSTGTPKGVVVTHRGMVNLLSFMEELLAIGPGDRVLGLTPLTFDISGLERFLPLWTGARVDLVDRATAANPFALAETIARLGSTVLQATPAAWQLLAQTGWRGTPDMKLLCGGEALNATLAAYLLSQGGPVWNVYGPTETTIWSTYHRVAAEDLPEISIGRPLWNTRVLILDSRLQVVPPGVQGEICLGGIGLAEGYLNREELTRERFPEDPTRPGERIYRTGDLGRWRPDGSLAYLGRIDHQVKIRGYRIELEEVEAVLARHPGVAQAVVDVRDGQAGPRMVGFLVARPGAELNRLSLQAFLKEFLPAYMVPDQFVSTGSLPLINGKVDRKAIHLRPLANSSGETPHQAPRDASECLLAQIWEELLDRSDIGILDDFFDLGGHSLLIVRLLARIEQVFGRRLPAAALFEGTTIESLAVALQPKGEELADQPWLQVQAGSLATLFYLHGDLPGWGLYSRTLAAQLGPDRPLVVLHPHGIAGQGLAGSIEEMAADHLTLVRGLQPRGPYLLGGYCNGALEAMELARQLRAQGEEVAWLGLVAPPPPNAPGRDLDAALKQTEAWTLLAPQVHRPALGAILAAVARFDPPVQAGPATLFRAEKDPATELGPSDGWDRIFPDLQVRPIPGDHVNCLAHPGLGVAFRESLQEAGL